MEEVRVMRLINFSLTCSYQDLIEDEQRYYIVMEFIPGIQLFTYIRKSVFLKENEILFSSSLIILMLEFLHSRKIVYRDLKPENLMIDRNGYLKLIDFGFSIISDKRCSTLCGTPEYMAPEIV